MKENKTRKESGRKQEKQENGQKKRENKDV